MAINASVFSLAGDRSRSLGVDLSQACALVVDANPTSRSILINQLKDLGFSEVMQGARVTDARRMLEFKRFDVVVCEQHFGRDASTGQDLLDDLRRNQLLPFSTVFIMVTAEASYAKVAEAAESALDGYLLKPHTAAGLADRLAQARQRKTALKDVFDAIELEDYQRAADLCLQRFEGKGTYGLYAARIGAELLLKLEKYDEAQILYEAVVAAKTLPWAKLGVARSLLGVGETTKAIGTLEMLISEEPSFADAYDVLGRAQFDLGRFDRALDIFRMACELTPYSLNRLQQLGVLTYYAGERSAAEPLLARAVRLGLDSKMFDPQALVLLAFVRLPALDRRGLQQCRDDFAKLLERHADSLRHRRLAGVVDALCLIRDRQFAKSVEAVRDRVREVKAQDFDFEAGANLVGLMAELASQAIQLDDVESAIDTLGMRFCTSRSMSEILISAARQHPPYAERLKACSAKILKFAENAMTMSMGGNPSAAVEDLLVHGGETQNAKLVETAYLVLQRYAAKIPELARLTVAVQEMRSQIGLLMQRSPLGGEQTRSAGGLALPVARRPVPVPAQ